MKRVLITKTHERDGNRHIYDVVDFMLHDRSFFQDQLDMSRDDMDRDPSVKILIEIEVK